MDQTEIGWQMSFPLSAKDWPKSKEQSQSRSAQSSASYRRSGCSPAEPYPPYECYKFTRSIYPSRTKGTSLLCRKGDISTLH